MVNSASNPYQNFGRFLKPGQLCLLDETTVFEGRASENGPVLSRGKVGRLVTLSKIWSP